MHVFVDGKIAEEGGPELAEQLEAEGYDKYLKAAAAVSRQALARLPQPPTIDER